MSRIKVPVSRPLADVPPPEAPPSGLPTDASEILPPGWTMTTLGNLVDRLQYGHTAKAAHGKSGPRFLRITDLTTEGVDWATVPSCLIDQSDFEKYRLAHGDMVFARSGSIEKAWLVESPPDAIFASYLIRGRPKHPQFGTWLKYFIKSRDYLIQIGAVSAGTGMQNVNAKKLGSVRIPLPPIPEQRWIVTRLEALKARSCRARAKLAEVPAQLAHARQSLLAAAFRGDLTADWRGNNQTDQLVTDLIKLAHSQRDRKGDPVPPAIELEGLPSTWRAVSLDDVVAVITSGSRDWSPYYRDDGYGVFILAQNIRPLRLDLSSVQRVCPPANHRDKARSQVEPNDLLVTIVGAGTGQVCRVPKPLPNHFVCQSVALVRPAVPEMGTFLEFYFNSSTGAQGQFDKAMYGQGRPHLGFDQLRSLAIPLPPLPEQHEIVRRLNTAFARLDAAATALAAAVAALDRLDQSLLARAFSGGLSTNNPAPETTTAKPAVSVQAQTYLLRFIPALLRAVGHPVSLDDLNKAVALRFLPAAELLPVIERIGGAAASAHFKASPLAYEDGAFRAAMRLLRRADAITITTDRHGIQFLSVGPKSPPSTPSIDADARHLAPLLSHVPTESVAPIFRRLQSVEVREELLATP